MSPTIVLDWTIVKVKYTHMCVACGLWPNT